MKRILDTQLEAYRQEMVANWKTHTYHQIPARFEAPLGEWIDTLAGTAWALRSLGKLPDPVGLTGKEGFDAQGLEGKIVIETNLASAVTYWSQCLENRANVYA